MSEPMAYRLLTPTEVSAIEAKVDAFFDSQPVPGRTIAEARWKVLTAVEDSLRLNFAAKANAWIDPSALSDRVAFISLMDRYKYSLKYSLDLLARARLPDSPVEIKKFGNDEGDYLSINYLLHGEAMFYAKAVGTFTSIWSGIQTAFGKPDRDVILSTPADREIQYHSTEILTGKHIDDYTPIPLLALVFAASPNGSLLDHEQMEWGETIKSIVESVRVRNNALERFLTEMSRGGFPKCWKSDSRCWLGLEAGNGWVSHYQWICGRGCWRQLTAV